MIPFPFAFLIGSFLADLLGWLADYPELSVTAGHLLVAGLASAVLAAVPGAVDYFYTVPPKSSARTRARTHALSNLLALALFAGAWVVRGFGQVSSLPSLGLQSAAVIALAYAAWQGGVLVSRNLISVDHRHAQAGRWREVTVSAHEGPIVVATKDELKEGQMKLVRWGDRRLVLARTDTGYRAFDDRCTHRGASLADGVLIGGTVQCLWHGSRFDCHTGGVAGGPAREPLRTYTVLELPEGIAISLKPAP